MDGTLLNDNGEIGQETVKLIKQLKNEGVRFSLATARLPSAVTEYTNQLGLEIPVVTLDGALIQSMTDKKIIFEAFVPEKYVKKAIAFADKYLLKIALCHVEAIYYSEFNAALPYILDKLGAEFREIPSYENYTKGVLEIVVAGEQNDAIKYLNDRMSFPYSFGLNSNYYKSHSHKGIYYSEIRKKGVSKGSGLERLAKHLKIKINETAVLGDWYNDRSMFETDALKIAMGNAVNEIKRMADYITGRTNNEDGVAEFLEMVLKARKD